MKIRLTISIFLLVGVLLVLSCSKKKAYPPIAEWEEYNDQFSGLRFKHPKGWHLNADGNRIALASTIEAAERFVDPRADDSRESDIDAQITVFRERPDSLKALDEIVSSFIKDRSSEGFLGKTAKEIIPQTIMLDSTEARKFTYYGNYTQQNKVTTTRVYAIRDSVVYYLEYAAFNDFFEPYSHLMDTLIASIRLPRPKVKAAGADPSLPSTTFTDFSNSFLRISYPDNFEAATPSVKGETKFSLEIKGYRQDCTVRIDVLPAKGLSVEKVFEQNQGKFSRVSGKGETTIAGTKALFLNYSPAKDIGSRAYFLVKNDQVYRIIMNFYAPKRADFLPAFEKTVGSLRIG
ncbi:MAG: hypothetical protein ONB46_24390 [candidate division KSB1 bacterium]|nr:hypothetical protein [candidate division KSB1 bacterium]MDZ7369057.1 hypothetical protein [candidate division KSB1 bacterium]MDZ7407282.1 hypothetical protein [candidate division KSB1 bacterium]